MIIMENFNYNDNDDNNNLNIDVTLPILLIHHIFDRFISIEYIIIYNLLIHKSIIPGFVSPLFLGL